MAAIFTLQHQTFSCLSAYTVACLQQTGRHYAFFHDLPILPGSYYCGEGFFMSDLGSGQAGAPL